MIHRKVSRLSFEARHRIAPLQHDLVDEPVGLLDRSRGVINKRRLNRRPALSKVGGFLWCQRADFKLFDPVLASLELRFTSSTVTCGRNRLRVFGTEVFAQPL